MRADDKTYNLIEDYLNSKLTDSELNAFEKEMQNNPELKQQVKLQKFANELVIENRLLEVKDILLEQKNPSGSKSIWKYIVGGLAGALLITGVLWFKNHDRKQTPKEDSAAIAKPHASESSSGQHSVAPVEETTAEKPAQETKKSAEPASDAQVADHSKTDEKIEHTPFDPATINVIEENKTQQDEVKEKKEPQTAVTDACQTAHITATIHANPACSGEDDGSILVNDTKGGQGPYNVYVYDSEHQVKNSPLKLHAGVYEVEVKDHNGCSRKFEKVIVAAKECPKDYEFNPFTGEKWTVPTNHKEGKLFIYNDNGAVVVEKDLHAGAEEQWSGESKTGEINAGFYIFVIKYKDGTQTQGSVTIVR